MTGTREGGIKSSEGGKGNREKASPAAVEQYLKGIDFPADKEDLVSQAKTNEAPEDVLKVLERFDDKEYHTIIEVSKAVSDKME